MKYKVDVRNYRSVHYYGQCLTCEFVASIDGPNFPESAVRAAIRKHVADTGHQVTLGKGSEALYFPVNSKDSNS